MIRRGPMHARRTLLTAGILALCAACSSSPKKSDPTPGPGPAERPTAASVLREVVAEAGAEDDGESDPRSWLYADLKGEQVLAARKGPETPRELLDRYNVALVQAVLLKAESMTPCWSWRQW